MPDTVEAIVILTLFVFPGFLCWRMVLGRIPGTFVSDVRQIAISLGFSVFVHMAALPYTLAIAGEIYAFRVRLAMALTKNETVLMRWSLVLWLLCILFVIPTVGAAVVSSIWKSKWSQPFFNFFGLAPLNLTPNSWDEFFLNQSRGCWVVSEMTDGSRIGGVYGTSSFASLSPGSHDLYLEECYNVDDDHDLMDEIPDNIGVWIDGTKVSHLHFYRSPEKSEPEQK